MSIKKRNTLICFSVLLLSILYYFMITADSIFTVHDDILTYMQVQKGDLWLTALNDAKHGRISHIPLTFLLYIPYLSGTKTAVRIFSTASVVFDMTALYLLIKNNISKAAGFLSCLLFISFACISNQHSLLTSYTLGHQIPIGLVLFSLNDFTAYYSSGNKISALIRSAFLFFTASFLYEACAAYIILFFLIAMYKNKGNIFRNCSRILYDTHFHMLLLLLYVVIYYGWRRIYPSDYDGAKLYFGNIPQSFITMFIYSFGMFPGVSSAAMFIKKYITAEEFISSLNAGIIIIPLITALTFYFVFPKINKPRNSGALTLFCITGLFIPNIIISFTSKYTQWTKNNSYSYVTSFYSYFFLILLILLTLKFFVKSGSKPCMIFVSAVVFLISAVSSAGKIAWNTYFEKNLNRYTAFSAAVSDEYFDSLSDGTVVYIPDYSGIHNDMNITASFASVYTSADITFVNRQEDIDFSSPVVFLSYDETTGTMTAGTLDSDMQKHDTICIYPK